MFRSSPLAESLSPSYPDIRLTPLANGAMHDRPQRKAPPAPIHIPAPSPMLDGTPDPMSAFNDSNGGGISIPGLTINDQEVDGEIHVTWVSAHGTSTVFVVAGPNAARLDGEGATIVQKDGMLIDDVGDEQENKSKKSGIGYRGLVGGTARKVSYVPASKKTPGTPTISDESGKDDNEGDNVAGSGTQAKAGRITRFTARTKALSAKASSKSRSAPTTATTPSAEDGSKIPSPQGSTRTRAFTRNMAATATTSPYFDKADEKKSSPKSSGPKDKTSKESKMGTKEKSKSKSKSKPTGTFPRARRDTFSPVSVYQTPRRLGSKGA